MTQPANPYALDLMGAVPQAPASPPQPAPSVPLNTSGMSIGGGLSLPQSSIPTQPPPAPPPVRLSPQALRDAAAGARNIQTTISAADENRRQDTLRALRQSGAVEAMPSDQAPTGKAAAPLGGVASPFMAKAAGASAAAGGAPDYYKLGQAPAGRIGKEYEAATREAGAAGERLEHAQGVQANLEADIQRRHAEGMQEAEHNYSLGVAQAQRERAAHEAETKAHLDKIQAAQDDLAKDRIDPDRIYGDHKTAGKLMGGLAVALGAAGASLGHTENFAQKYIDSAIQHDLDAQKENHAIKGQKVQGMINLYDRHRQEGMDHEAAEAATRADLYQHTLRMGDAQAEKSGSNVLKQRWSVQRQALAAQAAQAQQAAAMEVNRLGWQTTQKGAGATSKIDEQTAKADLENQDEMAAAQRLRSAPEGELAGYGTGGKIRHWLSDKTGLDLESNEAKANRRDVETLESHALKRDGGRVNSDELQRFGKNVRDESDVRGLTADEIRRAKLEHEQAKKGLLGKGGGGKKGGEEE